MKEPIAAYEGRKNGNRWLSSAENRRWDGNPHFPLPRNPCAPSFNSVARAKAVMRLAEDFGATVEYGQFKLDPGAKKDAGMRALKKHGAKHSKEADVKAEAETRLRQIERELDRETNPDKRAKLEKEKAKLQAKLAKVGPLSDAAIESELPLEQYKQVVLTRVGAELDKGRQIRCLRESAHDRGCFAGRIEAATRRLRHRLLPTGRYSAC